MRYIRSVLVAAMVLPAAVAAQTNPDTLSLVGRSSLQFGLGLIGSRDVSATAHGVGAHASGGMVSLSFSHWVTPSIAAEVNTGLLGATSSAGFSGNAQVNAITPILFGLSVSPRGLALGKSLRPYASIAAGPYIHTASDASIGGASASSEAAPGARLAVGANLFVSRHFMLAVSGDYDAVGRFSRLDAASEHPSGFGMSFALGVTWGGR